MPGSNPDLSVLQIVKGLDIGNVHGGAERFAVELAECLRQDGMQVSLCSFFRTGSAAEANWMRRMHQAGIECFSVADWAGNNELRSYRKGVANLHAFLRRNPHKILHSHFQLGTVAGLGMKGLGLCERVVRTCHVTSEWETGWYGWAREQLFSKWIFPLCLDAEVGVSQVIVDRLRAYPGAKFGEDKIQKIPNGISSSAFVSALTLQKEKNEGRSGKVVGVVGRLSIEKGQRFLIEAMALLPQSSPEIVGWLVGDGDQRPNLEQAARELGVDERVIFWGWREDALNLIAKMDLLVLPSLREGLPTVVLEGFAQGTPVAAADIPGIRELVRPEESGWLFQPASPESLAKTILEALQDEPRRLQYSQAGKEIARDYTIQAAAEKYRLLYQRLAGSKAG